MDLLVFITYFFISFTLFLIPSKIWDGIDWQLSKDLNMYGSNPWLWTETVQLFNYYKKLNSYEASEELMELISKLVKSLELICELHKESRKEYKKRGLFNTVNPPFPTGIGPTEPCDIKVLLEDLHDKLKRANLKAEFSNILDDFHRTFPKDTYIQLTGKIISHSVGKPAVFHKESDSKNISEVAKSSRYVLTQLMYHLGTLIHIIDTQLDSAMQKQQYPVRTTNEKTIREIAQRMELKLNSLLSRRKDVPFFVLKIFILLCAHHDIWMSSIYIATNIQFYFAIINTVLMLMMYSNLSFVFSITFHLQVLFCRLYKRFVGCPCKFRNFYTFKMLETLIEDSRKERRRFARYRYHRKR